VIGLSIWQDLLSGLGWVLARLYDFVPSYAFAIIVLTVFIRLLLLPLGIKQVRSMHAMTALQPKVKAIQTKYKGNKARQQEEIQKLYAEHGVNPLGGCLPMVLQIPVLIALYSVLRFPTNVGAYPENQPAPHPHSHIPVGSSLYDSIINQQGDVRWLLCSAGQAGGGEVQQGKGTQNTPLVAESPNGEGTQVVPPLDCGTGIPVRIPYYALALFMVATTYYQSRQMARANPSGSQQQQALTRIMPLLFGVWGFLFPAGLVVYWTTSNLWQIGQQHFVIRARQRDEAAIASGTKAPPAPKKRGGLMSGMMERAQQERQRRGGQTGSGSSRPTGGSSGSRSGSGNRSSSTGNRGKSGSSSSKGTVPASGTKRPAPPDPNKPRTYKPASTSGRGTSAPRGTRSPLGVAGDDGSVSSPGSDGSGNVSSSQGGTTKPTQSGQRPSGSRGSAGSRKKRRKR